MHRWNLPLAVLFVFLHCQGISQVVHAEIVAPPLSENSTLLPVVVRILADGQQPDHHFNGTFTLLASGATLGADPVRIIKGVGTVTADVLAAGEFVLSLEGLDGSLAVPVQQGQQLLPKEGSMSGNETWTSDADYLVTGDLTILPGASLVIEKGTTVLLASKANLFVEGGLRVNGEPAFPVRFQPADKADPWGGIMLLSTPDSVTFSHCFFMGGGGDEDHIYGHSQSQPVVMVEGGQASFTGCYFLDNAGKATGGHLSRVTITDCIVSRCDTGGEHHECHVAITNSRFTEMPDGDGLVEDDDNDGIYIAGNHPSVQGPSLVKGCVFSTGEDDGIDHNGANLNVMSCWIEGFYHEGIAASNTNTIHVYNTLVRNCEQGIEAGYGTPQVTVDHCTIIGNSTGIRFGDSYDWGCEGSMEVTNSILHANDDNVLNYDNLVQGPVEGAVEISYTMTNDPEYDGGAGCVTGTPLFNNDYLLQPGSAGTGLASDGSDLGLVTTYLGLDRNVQLNAFIVYPNPCTDGFFVRIPGHPSQSFTLTVHDSRGIRICTGSYILSGGEGDSIWLSTAGWVPGLYMLGLSVDGIPAGFSKILKIDD